MKDEMVSREVAEAMARLGEAKVREIRFTMQALAPVIRDFLDSTVTTLQERIRQLEDRPTLKYAGLWNEHQQFNEGEFVTDHGSLWFCKATTRTRPGASKDWQLAVKRGRDAK